MKISKTKQNAVNACNRINRISHITQGDPCDFTFIMQWKKSTYGLCPSIYFQGSKVASTYGCEYCKESAALSDFLSNLFKDGTKAKKDMRDAAGCGIPAIMRILAKNGYLLYGEDHTKLITAYTIRKTNTN